MADGGADGIVSSPNLIILDQNLVCFDVEQQKNATEQLSLRRVSSAKGLTVHWRLRTNAPTRYIVSPRSGVLVDDRPVTISLELYGNRFSPQHQIIVQAVAEKKKGVEPWATVSDDPSKVQSVSLELGTTFMILERNIAVGNDAASQSTSLHHILEVSTAHTTPERLKELADVLAMVKADTLQLVKNAERTQQLRETLEKQLEKKRESTRALDGDLKTAETELQVLVQRRAADAQQRAAAAVARGQTQQQTANSNCSVS